MFCRKLFLQTLRSTHKCTTTLPYSKACSSIKVPCLPFTMTDSNRLTRFQTWRITNLLSHTRQNQFDLRGTKSEFMHLEEIFRDYFMFYVCLKVSMTRQFHDVVSKAFYKRPIPHEAMEIHMKTGYVGKKSGSFVSNLVYQHLDQLTPELDHTDAVPYEGGKLSLAECIISYVVVDKQTRKSVAPPAWWLEMYQGLSRPQYKLGPLLCVDIPKKEYYYSHRIVVRWNDTDWYKHVNYQIYLQYCLEAANDAVNNDFFKDGFSCSGDIFRRDVKEIVVNYLRESLPGDQLTVYLWRGNTAGGCGSGGSGGSSGGGGSGGEIHNSDKNTQEKSGKYLDDVIHFSVEKQTSSNRLTSDVICQASFTFFPATSTI